MLFLTTLAFSAAVGVSCTLMQWADHDKLYAAGYGLWWACVTYLPCLFVQNFALEAEKDSAVVDELRKMELRIYDKLEVLKP